MEFPKGEDKRLDALLFLYVENAVFHIEGIEGNRVVLLVGEVDAVLAAGLVVNQVAKPLVGVPGIYQQDVCSLLVVLPNHVVGKERLAGAARP